MTASGFNPYSWDSTSLLVQSDVMSLVLKDHEGRNLVVKDSNREIELKIPRHLQPTQDDSFFIKPSNEGNMQYHTINVPHALGNTMRLKVSNVIAQWLVGRFWDLKVESSIPGRCTNVVFLTLTVQKHKTLSHKTLNSHSASLHPGV